MTDPFAAQVDRYDRWYERHPAAYAAELAALRALRPSFRRGLEVGVGTGRFAAPLGVAFGVRPCPSRTRPSTWCWRWPPGAS